MMPMHACLFELSHFFLFFSIFLFGCTNVANRCQSAACANLAGQIALVHALQRCECIIIDCRGVRFFFRSKKSSAAPKALHSHRSSARTPPICPISFTYVGIWSRKIIIHELNRMHAFLSDFIFDDRCFIF